MKVVRDFFGGKEMQKVSEKPSGASHRGKYYFVKTASVNLSESIFDTRKLFFKTRRTEKELVQVKIIMVKVRY